MLGRRNSGRLPWLERRIDLLSEAVGFDLVTLSSLAPVIAEIRAGRDIKAAQVYCELFGCGTAEGVVAVADLRRRLDAAAAG